MPPNDRTGLDIPISDSGIAQFPDGFEQRVIKILTELANLEAYTPERHDLAASKLLRGNDHDRAQLALLHAIHPLDIDVLVERVRSLLRDLVGNPTEARWSFRHFVEETWGELAAEQALAKLDA